MAYTLQPPYAVPTFASLSSNTWPRYTGQASLNNSVSGRLQTFRPWAAVCYTSDPLYSAEECLSVLSGYENDTQACLNINRALRVLTLGTSVQSGSRIASVTELGVVWFQQGLRSELFRPSPY